MERVGPYELHQRIGVGGMAEVWRGAHAPTGRPVAVKLVSLSSVREPRLVRALRSEVRIAARLRHPHVVRLYDQGTVRVSESSETLAAGAPWMVMALGSGSLEEREPATWGELAVVLEQMLGALGHAHARGVLHLDLKPANVLWTPHGVALADFGIARALDEAEVAPTGGTLGFMPPEQLEARTAALGPWSDLYAFGRTASALATGLRVPPGFDAFVARCTCTEPDERFAFAAEAAAVLRGFGDPSVVYVGAAEAGDDTFVFDDLATAAPASSLAPAAPCPVPSLSVPAHPPQAILPGHEPALGLFGLVEPPIMGRTEERRRLWRAVEAAVCGLGRVVVLSGPVGVGKTRLATWTARCAHEAGVARIVRVIHSAGRSPGTGVVELGRRLLGVEGLSPEARRARLLSPAGPRTSLVRRVLTDERVPMDEQVAVVGRLVIEASEERPLVLVLDDVHLDRGSLALLRFLARRPGRVLTLATNEDGPTDDVAATHLSLGPLDDATIGDLVRELVDAPRATVERVVARCGGSPLLAMQTLGDWVRRGALSVHDADDQRADWQARLSLLLADRAETAARGVEVAAALGTVFRPEEWGRACGQAGLVVDGDLLGEMAERGLLVERDREQVVFAHPLLREMVEEGMVAAGRAAAVHTACAKALDPDAEPLRVARHLVAAGRNEEALPHFLVAAWRRLDALDPGCQDLLDELDAVATDAGLPDDHAMRLQARAFGVRTWAILGEPRRGVSQGHALLPAARRLGGETLAATLVALGRNHLLLGELTEAHACFTEAIEVPYDRVATRVTAWLHLGLVAVRQGALDDADAHLRQSLELSRSAGWEGGMRDACRQLGYLAQTRGDLAEADAWYRQVEDHALDEAGLFAQISLATDRGELARARGDLDLAEQEYRRALSLAKDLDVVDDHYPYLNLGLVAMARGDDGEASVWLGRARRAAEQAHLDLGLDLIDIVGLPLLARRGDWGEVLRRLQGQRVLCHRAFREPDLLVALHDVAAIAEAAGEHAIAAEALRQRAHHGGDPSHRA